MQAKPLISVIVPVYNVEPYLRQCLDSILGQSYTQLEIILINDGSTDASGTLCDEYARLDRRIQVVHQENRGLSAARNRGLELASGEYLSFVDSDDWLELDMYTDLVGILHQYQDLDVLKFAAIKKSKHNPRRSGGKLKRYMGVEAIQANRRGQLRAMAWDALYRRATLGHLRFSEGYYCEDVDYNLRVFSQQDIRVAVSGCRYYHYRPARPGSIMNSKGNQLLDDLLTLWHNLLEEKRSGDADIYSELLASFLTTLRNSEGNILKDLDRGRLSSEDAEYRKAKLKATWQSLTPRLDDRLVSYLDFGAKFHLRYPRLYHSLRHPIRTLKYYHYLPNK